MKNLIIILIAFVISSNVYAEDVSERCLAFKDFEKTNYQENSVKSEENIILKSSICSPLQ